MYAGVDDQLGIPPVAVAAAGSVARRLLGRRRPGPPPKMSASAFITWLKDNQQIAALQDIADDGEGPSSESFFPCESGESCIVGKSRHRFGRGEQQQAARAVTELTGTAPAMRQAAGGGNIIARALDVVQDVAPAGSVGAGAAAVAARIARGRSPAQAAREAVAAGEVSPEAAARVAEAAGRVEVGARTAQVAAGGQQAAAGIAGALGGIPPVVLVAGVGLLAFLFLRGRR